MNSMKYIRFSNFIKSTQYGFTANKTFNEDGVYKYLRITDIVPYFVNKDKVPFCEISDEKACQYLVNEDDLLIARTGATTGYNFVVPKGFNNYIYASYLVRYFYDKNVIYPKYLKHVLKSQQWYGFVNNYIGGSAQPGMNPKTFGKFQFPFVEYSVQMKISYILESYDSLIENNNKRIKILEQMTEELYKEWFVRFRYPNYEKNAIVNGIPDKWDVVKLGDICKLKSGFAFKSEWWTDEGVSVIKIKDIKNNSIDFNDLSHISYEHAQLAKQFYVKEGDFLIALTGATIGKTALVPHHENLLVVNQRVGKFFMGENSLENVGFLYLTLNQKWIQELIVSISSSNAAQPNISPYDIENIKVLYSKEIVSKFNAEVEPIFKEILMLQRTSANLIKQRDLLLPRLMSGKLEVK